MNSPCRSRAALLDPVYLYATLAAMLVGLSKTGVPGIGILQVPLMAFVVGDAKDSVGVLLPILMIADLFAIYFYQKYTNWKKIIHLAPWILAGIAVGSLALIKTDKSIFGPVLGGIVLFMALFELLKNRLNATSLVHHPTLRTGVGIATGFSTTVGNAAGPIMNLYLLSHKVTKQEFLGVTCWLFFLINLVKLPIFIGLDMVRPDTLKFNLFMIPGIAIGALVGRWILPRISNTWFNHFVMVFSILSAIKLIIS